MSLISSYDSEVHKPSLVAEQIVQTYVLEDLLLCGEWYGHTHVYACVTAVSSGFSGSKMDATALDISELRSRHKYGPPRMRAVNCTCVLETHRKSLALRMSL